MAHYYGALASLGLGVRLINTRHNMGSRSAGSRSEWLYRATLPITEAVVAVSHAARDVAVERIGVPAARAAVAANGIVLGGFHPRCEPAHRRWTETLGVPARTRLIGTVGRLHPAKDHAGLLDAYVRVRRRHPDTVPLIAGDGPLRAMLESRARAEGLGDHVRFLGDRADVGDLLGGLDLFVLSSVTEGYPVVLVEACASGLPIVATDVGGNAEIVEHERNGLLVPPRNPAALASAIVAVLEQPERGRTMGAAGRRWALAYGSVAAMATRYEAIYGASDACAPCPSETEVPCPGRP